MRESATNRRLTLGERDKGGEESDKDEMRCFLSNHNTHHQSVCFFLAKLSF
jgi:hypothetical protein